MTKLRQILPVLVALLLSAGGLKAQQTPIFTNYTNSYAYINPGFAGLSEGVNLLGLYRQQWAGSFVDDQGNSLAPTTFLLTGDMPIRALGGGISFSVLNDKLGYENNVNVGLGYAYHIDMGGSTLGIGASVALLNRSLDFSHLVFGTTGDPLGGNFNNERNAMMFDVSAGVFWQIPDSFYLGISGINLLESTSRALGDDDSGASFTTDRTFYAVAGYPLLFETLPAFKFIPSVGVMSDLASTQLNAGVKAVYNDVFSLGVNYRPQESVGITVGLAIKDFVLGYAYDINTMGYHIKGSHEIAFSYCFKLDMDRTPRDYRSVRYL
ncbi:MAG: PorP/SprF family type IX secretion system membrane protein [Bacteroidales bacterium]|nr:PorP/SprF family type IX secretion system membrane protein [Bacteroidales bacterium]